MLMKDGKDFYILPCAGDSTSLSGILKTTLAKFHSTKLDARAEAYMNFV